MAENQGRNPKERNRLWWEQLPMSYVEWNSEDRNMIDLADQVLDTNPFLQTFNFGACSDRIVLDVGCGAGATACLFALGGAKVMAIDLTSNAVTLTKQNAAKHRLAVVTVRMDAEKMALKGAAVDHVFSWGVLHHSNDTRAAFGEVSRVLRVNGTALIMVYNRASLRYYLKGLYWLIAKGKVSEVGWSLAAVQQFYTDGYYHRHYTANELIAELNEVGLRCKRVISTHMAKPMIPLFPRRLDELLKRKWGWLLVAEVEKA